MKITASIGEADIASIKEGQEVRISLQSLPGRRYTSKVLPVIFSYTYLLLLSVSRAEIIPMASSLNVLMTSSNFPTIPIIL